MLDSVSISLIIGLATLVVERIFAYVKKIKQSNCCGSSIVRDTTD